MNSEESTSSLHANMTAIAHAGVTAQEATACIATLGPAMQAAWDQCRGDDALWAMRARKHGRLRTWLLRWQLTRMLRY